MTIQSINANSFYSNFSPVEIDLLSTQDVSSQQVFAAIDLGDIPALEALLADPVVDLLSHDEAGDTPLHRAVRTGNAELVRALVNSPHGKNNAVLNAPDHQTRTALTLAMTLESQEIVEILMTGMMTAQLNGRQDITALSVEKIFLDIAQNALDAAGLNLSQTQPGSTTLSQAQLENPETIIALAKEGKLAGVLPELLAAKVHINHCDEGRNTALMWAARKGHTADLEALLAAGAYVNHVNYNEDSALMWAAAGGHLDSVKVLLAATTTFVTVDVNTSVNLVNRDGWTALMFATRIGHLYIVKALLASNANVNHSPTDYLSNEVRRYATLSNIFMLPIHTPDPGTALILATAGDHEFIVKALLEAKADVHTMKLNGDTAFAIAKRNNYRKIAALLEDAGAAPLCSIM